MVHMPTGIPDFRLGSVLATSFTGTLTERRGTPVERLPTPDRLRDWLGVNGLEIGVCTAEQLECARELREAIHLAATAAAGKDVLPWSSLQAINAFSARGHAAATLTPEGRRRWRLTRESGLDDALGVIAADAIDVISGERDGKLALCASPTCRAAFFDTSQSRTRKWCEMNTCGNRQKKARFHEGRRAEPGATG